MPTYPPIVAKLLQKVPIWNFSSGDLVEAANTIKRLVDETEAAGGIAKELEKRQKRIEELTVDNTALRARCAHFANESARANSLLRQKVYDKFDPSGNKKSHYNETYEDFLQEPETPF